MREIPEVDGAMLERIASREFPKNAKLVLAMLDEYGSETWHREPHRVRAAVLFLARGKIERLRESIEVACIDYRDVLYWAEYPNYDNGPEARAQDHARYQEWLHET